MKIKKFLLTIAISCFVLCAGIFVFSGCEEQCKHTEAEHHSAVAATCTTEGNIEYWYCGDCENYFSDNRFKNIITEEATVTAIDADNHDYGFVYNHDTKEYDGTCSRSSQHTTVQQAGTEDFPYLAGTEAELKAAIAKGGYIKMTEDLTVSSLIQINNNVTIDLDGTTVASSAQYVFVIGANPQKATIKNGTIKNTYDTAGKSKYGVYAYAGSDVTLVDCVIEVNDAGTGTVNGYAVFVYSKSNPTLTTKISLDCCTVNSNYAGVYSGGAATVTLENTDISVKKGNTEDGFVANGFGVYVDSQDSLISMTDVNVEAKNGVNTFGDLEIVGGTIDVTNLGITINSKHVAYEDVEEEFFTNVIIDGATITSENRGMQLQTTKAMISETNIHANGDGIAALRDTQLEMEDCEIIAEGTYGIVGNGSTNLYNDKGEVDGNCGLDTIITLTDCTVKATWGVYLPQVGGEFTMTGGKIEGKTTGIEIRAGKVILEGVEIISTYTENFDATKNGSGTTVKGAAVAVSQHTTNDDIKVTIRDCTLSGYYALYEQDLMDDESDNIEITFERNVITGGVYSENCSNIDNIEPATDEDGIAL